MKQFHWVLVSVLGVAAVSLGLAAVQARADGSKTVATAWSQQNVARQDKAIDATRASDPLMEETDARKMGETSSARDDQLNTMMDSMKSMVARAQELNDTMVKGMKETPGPDGGYEGTVQQMAETMGAMAQLLQQTEARYAEMQQNPGIMNDPQMNSNLDYLRHQADSLGSQMDRQMQAMEKLGQEIEQHTPAATANPVAEQYP